MADMIDTDWCVLTELRDGTLQWGAAVGACWPLLQRARYVEPHFGGITEAGRAALAAQETKQ
jgi:hypothetical protein